MARELVKDDDCGQDAIFIITPGVVLSTEHLLKITAELVYDLLVLLRRCLAEPSHDHFLAWKCFPLRVTATVVMVNDCVDALSLRSVDRST